MRNLLGAAVLALALSGCAVMSGITDPLHAPQTDAQAATETPAQKAVRVARQTIDEANGALIALNTIIKSNVHDQVWTPDEGQSRLNQTKKAGVDLDKARELLRLGNVTGAQAQAELIRTLLIELQRQAAAASRQSALDFATLT